MSRIALNFVKPRDQTTDLCPADEDDEDEDGGTEEEEREAGSHGDQEADRRLQVVTRRLQEAD